MGSYRKIFYAVSLVAILSMTFSGTLQAQGPTEASAQSDSSSSLPPAPQMASAEDDSWHFTIPLFVWTPGTHGTVGVLGHNAGVHVSGTDALSDLQFSLMGGLEARKKRLVIPFDFAWLNLASSSGVPQNDFGQTSARVKLNETFVTPRFGYRIVNTDRWTVDALAGIRYWHLGQDITLRPSQVSRDRSANWVDGLGGAQIGLALTNWLGVRILGDAGAGGSDIDYSASGWLNFKIKKNFGIIAGWRYLDVNYRGNNQFVYDVAQTGPVAGMVFEFGGKAKPAPTASCSVSPTEVWAGDPVAGTISTQNFDPKHAVSYKWTTSGGTVTGTNTTGSVSTAGLAPGSYTVGATATDTKEKKNNVASCSASFTVKQPHPPTATCSATPDSVKSGDPSTVTASASSPDGFPLSYAWSASAGQIGGTGTSATLNTTSAPPGSPVTVTAAVTDSRGLSTSCTATVNVMAPPPPVVVSEVSEIGECQFSDPKKPWRVDNTCKAVLDDVVLRIQKESDGKFVIVGYGEEEETVTMSEIGSQRAVNIKYYLTEGEGKAGIDPSRLEPRKGSAKSKSAKIYFVPTGVNFTEESVVVDETQVKGQSRNGPAPKKKSGAGMTQ